MTSTGPDQPENPEQPEPPAEQTAAAPGTPPFPQAPATNTLAIVSFVSAFFIGVVAIVTGFIALAQIRARGEAGRGLALAGIIIGSTATVFTALAVVFMIIVAATMGAMFFSVASETHQSAPMTATPTPDPTNVPDGSAEPSGRLGAADFDAGYLVVGAGPVAVDVYFDLMCPYCQQFERTNGGSLALAATNDVITLRLHPMTFLDRLSLGSNYSTRASSALTCQATLNPDLTVDYLAVLFANQPEEGSAGPSDDELVALAPGGVSIAACVASGSYAAWSQANTDAAVTGPIDGADIPAISGTPTVLVDGAVYRGSLTDPVEFAQFVTGAFTP